MVEVVKSLQEILHPKFLVENVYLFGILSVFLTMYGPHLHIRLPNGLRNLFNNPVFRSFVMFLIAYMSHRDFVAALTITIIFIVTMNLLHTIEVIDNVKENFRSNVEMFSMAQGPPVADCNIYEKTKEGTPAFYPLHAE